jgi:hypothetical protein
MINLTRQQIEDDFVILIDNDLLFETELSDLNSPYRARNEYQDYAEEYEDEKMMKVTVDNLHNWGACWAAIDWLENSYPEGAYVTTKTLETVPEKVWLVWLACKLRPDLGLVWAGIVFRYVAILNCDFQVFADKITKENCQQAMDYANKAADVAAVDDTRRADVYRKVARVVEAAVKDNAFEACEIAYKCIGMAFDGFHDAYSIRLSAGAEMIAVSVSTLLKVAEQL